MKYEYWFANLMKISCRRKLELRQVIKTAEALYYIEETELKQYVEDEKERTLILDNIRSWKLDEEYQKLQQKEAWFVTILDERYPERLRNIPSPPYAIFVKGSLPSEDRRSVAIVGARECTPYGEVMARDFAKTLAREGVQIISGMARGVDSAGQRGALEAGGTSFGVLGCGVDICYPASNRKLFEKIKEQGGVLSEFELGSPPLAYHFPQRNRVISGLADAILIIEAKEKSGSLITADCALEQGKTVFALPGRVGDLLSEGCNRLIYQGAVPAWCPEMILDEMNWNLKSSKKSENEKEKEILGLAREDNLVYSCLNFNPKNITNLQDETGLSCQEIMKSLVQLQIRGLAKEIWKNNYIRREE